MFKIPAAIGVPTTWKKIAYDRVGESLDVLNDVKRNTIQSTVNVDWSRQFISELTIEDLDELLLDKLPDSLNENQKKRKIIYLVNICLQSKEDKIRNIGTNRYPVWTPK